MAKRESDFVTRASAYVWRPRGGWRLVEASLPWKEGDHPIDAVEITAKEIDADHWDPIAERPYLFLEAIDLGEEIRRSEGKRSEGVWTTDHYAAVLDFVNRYGEPMPLFRDSHRLTKACVTVHYLAHICAMLTELSLMESGDEEGRREPHTRLEVTTWVDVVNGTLQTVAMGVLDACWLQFAIAVHRGDRFRRCPQCRTWIVRPGTQTGPLPAFCSPSCRLAAYRQRRRRAKELRAEGRHLRDIARECDTDIPTLKGWLKK